MICIRSCVLFLCGACAVALGFAMPGPLSAAEDDINLGPLFTRDTTLDGEKRVRILGPFYEERIATNGCVVKALRPLFARSVEADGSDNRTDLLWPLAVASTRGREVASRFATMYYTDFDKTNQKSRWRLWALPLLLMGRDAAGANYFGVFPLAGKVNEVLLFDRTEFFLFPLYARTFRGEEETTEILWPLISSTKAEGVVRGRLFPIYGRTVRPGVCESMFLFWPLLTWARYVRPGQAGGGFVFFPFIGRIYKADSKSWLLFPPFIRWTEGERLRELNLPWPFVQSSRGRVNMFYLWPLAGVKCEPGIRDGFLMWPIMRNSHGETDGQATDRLSVTPFLRYARRRNITGGSNEVAAATIERALKLWPLLSNRTVGETTRLEVPALWPSQDVDAIDNIYAPVWTLFSRIDTATSSDSELLWGLIRRRKAPAGASSSIFPLVSWNRTTAKDDTQEWSFLLGLFGYRKHGDHGSLRLLFMDFGGRKDEGKDPAGRGTGAHAQEGSDEEE